MRTLIVIILIAICLPGFAQKANEAAKLLEEVSDKTKSYESIKANFTYTMDNKAANIHETKTGTLLVSGDNYQLKAAGQTIFCDGTTVWTYIGESNEVQINDVDTRESALTPSKLLTSYNANYLSRIIRDKDASGPDFEAIELIPNSTKNFVKAILIINKPLKQVKAFKIFDKNGNTFIYNVTKFQVDVPIKDSDFTFVEASYPDVEVIDMR